MTHCKKRPFITKHNILTFDELCEVAKAVYGVGVFKSVVKGGEVCITIDKNFNISSLNPIEKEAFWRLYRSEIAKKIRLVNKSEKVLAAEREFVEKSEAEIAALPLVGGLVNERKARLIREKWRAILKLT
jgi:hypothetical protein